VATSTIPGERTSPTQPFPTKPPAFERQGLTHDDLIDFTPELRAEAIAILEDYTYGPLFTPPSLPRDDGHRGTILRPGAGGGANWPGAGIDPETGILYVPSADNPTVPFMGTLGPDESNFNYFRLANQGVAGPQGLPILKPPYATLTAIDMNKGEIHWQVANGDGMPRVESHPALAGVELPPLGGGGRHPVLVTSTLLIHGQNVDDGARLVARDKLTGEELASVELPGNPSSAPMSYLVDGRQFIAVAVSGQPAPELVVLALPQSNQ
jgi:quinoprotein glucose dehydrogenase